MIGCSKKNRDIVVIRENPFEQKQKNSNRGLALIGLRPTGRVQRKSLSQIAIQAS